MPDEISRIKAQTKDIERFASDIERFLYKRLRKLLANIADDKTSAQEAARILGSLETSLKELGLDKELAKIQRIYADDIKAIKATLKLSGAEKVFTDVDRQMIEALINGGYSQAATLTQRYIGDVRQQVGLAVLAGQAPDISQIAEIGGPKLERQLNTEIGTTIAAFHRTVTTSKAEELGFELFEYVGPKDSITRPFCLDLLEPLDRDVPIYTATEIRKLDNEQNLPVMQFGGGYNCRHQWLPISEEEARKE